jgi:arylsulfatase A-like enzyme
VFLDHLEATGLLAETTILLTADHGFEGADPDCTGDWLPALESAGVGVQDHGPGFLYLDAP